MSIQTSLDNLQAKWCIAHPNKQFPGFDPRVKNLPHTLIVLESPGPQVKSTGIVSPSNQDETAKEMQRLISIAFDNKAQDGVLCWNAIPWFLDRSPRAADVAEAKYLHGELLSLISPNLRYVLLL